MEEDDLNNNLSEYQLFLKEINNGNTEKAQSEINNNNNTRINDTANNFKTEIKVSDLTKKKIHFGFVNKKTKEDEKKILEEDTKGKTEEHEDYQKNDVDGDLANLLDKYFDIANVEVNNNTQKSYQLSENQKSELSENNSKSNYFENIMNTE